MQEGGSHGGLPLIKFDAAYLLVLSVKYAAYFVVLAA